VSATTPYPFIEPTGVYGWPTQFMPASTAVLDWNYLDDFNPSTIAAVPAQGSGSSIFSSPDEYEPASFVIVAASQMDDVVVSVSDLGNGGDTIPSENVTIRRVVRTPMRNLYTDAAHLTTVGRFLPTWSALTIPAGEFRQVWLTVHVPPGTKAATYAGTVRISSSQGSINWPLSVEVLPIQLLSDPGKTLGMQYNLQQRLADVRTGAATTELITQEIADLAAHGVTSIVPSLQIDFFKNSSGEPYYDLTNFVTGMNLLLDVGIEWTAIVVLPNLNELALLLGHTDVFDPTAGTIGDGASLAADATFQMIAKAAIQALHGTISGLKLSSKQTFEVIYKNLDEIFDDQFDGSQAPLYVQYAKTCQNVPGLTLGTTLSTRNATEISELTTVAPYVAVPINQGFTFEWYLATPGSSVQTYLNFLKAMKQTAWFYHNERGAYHTPAWKRIINGVYFWSMPFACHIPWCYQYDEVANPFDASAGDKFNDFGFSFSNAPGSTTFVPTRSWEAMREGWDDVRYFHTLQQAMATPGISAESLASAHQFFSRLQALIESVDLAGYEPEAGLAKESPIISWLASRMTGADWQLLRKEAAYLIVEIQGSGT
jgi:hypothetical protein